MDDQYNLTSRMFKAQAGFNTIRSNRRYVHSNFRLLKNIGSWENNFNNVQFSCCDFTPCGKMIIAGTMEGDVKLYDINNGNQEYTTRCPRRSITMVKCSSDGTLLLCATGNLPSCLLWSIENKTLTKKLKIIDDYYAEFANMSKSKILGTNYEAAYMYDISTKQVVSKYRTSISHISRKNRATFCPTDEIILYNGVLFDVKSGRKIHNFDRFRTKIPGVFHPNGFEVILDYKVWDLRTFRFLQNIPIFNECIKFSPQNVIYGFHRYTPDDRFNSNTDHHFDTRFDIFDSYDYSSISTMDVKRFIADLSVNKYGSLISLVELSQRCQDSDNAILNIYAVGMKKDKGEGPYVERLHETSSDESQLSADEYEHEFSGEPIISRYQRERLSGYFNSDIEYTDDSSDLDSAEAFDESFEEIQNESSQGEDDDNNLYDPAIPLNLDTIESTILPYN